MASDPGRAVRRLVSGYGTPLLLLVAAAAGFAWLVPRTGYYAVKLLLALAVAGALFQLWLRTQRTNRLLARFVTALAQGDLSQGFAARDCGAALDELAAAIDAALERLRGERQAAAVENRFAAALLDEVPTPLLTITHDARVHLANKAARALFREADGREPSAFARYGGAFATMLASIAPGGREVCYVLWNGLPRRALVSASAVDRQGRPARLLTVSVIHGEIERAELATQADLVRVLTHEIMNSLTPVTSLAESAAELLDTLDPANPQSTDEARLAVNTLARRAKAIARFVDSYRDFGRAPTVTLRRFPARAWADDLVRTFAAMPEAQGVALALEIVPERLRIDGDPELLGQVVLNLLKNGAIAARTHTDAPRLALDVRLSDADRVQITVTDNGAGVPEELRHEIFLPFFTTKAGGTGIGLSFARLVALLHGGALDLLPSDRQGSRFRLTI